MIKKLSCIEVYKKFLEQDENRREINIYKLENIQFVNDYIYYPKILVQSKPSGLYFNPIDEKVMSLEKLEMDFSLENRNTGKQVVSIPLFFFIYNTDNYYHFVYDTLPYLISYKYLQEEIRDLKILVNFPNYQSTKFYPFFLEFLKILGIHESDLIIVDKETIYSNVFISDSYTHGIDSNLPPRKEIYELYNSIVSKVNTNFCNKEFPSKIYISRRTWLHNDFSNIGTNYTSRRKLDNEDTLVDLLKYRGYTEIFTERLSTVEKIQLFSQVKEVVSTIGGGSCNVLFSKPQTKHICIVSPTFLEINNRFKYSLSNVQTVFFQDTEHIEKGYIKNYMRVSYRDIVGEVVGYNADKVLISYTKNFVAGWNSELNLEQVWVPVKEVNLLDLGLNSAWTMNLKKFENTII